MSSFTESATMYRMTQKPVVLQVTLYSMVIKCSLFFTFCFYHMLSDLQSVFPRLSFSFFMCSRQITTLIAMLLTVLPITHSCICCHLSSLFTFTHHCSSTWPSSLSFSQLVPHLCLISGPVFTICLKLLTFFSLLYKNRQLPVHTVELGALPRRVSSRLKPERNTWDQFVAW
jgi:hypothetical protein